MSGPQINLCSTILKEFYGDIVEKVAVFLLRNGSSPLRKISYETSLKLDEVKKSLAALIQQNVASFEMSKHGFVEYCISVEQVLLRLRFPKYVYCAKTLYGDAAELVVESLLYSGQAQMSATISKVTERLNEAYEVQPAGAQQNISHREVIEKFGSLANTHFIQRCSAPRPEAEETPVPTVTVPLDKLYEVPKLTVENKQGTKRKHSLDNSDKPAKRHKSDSTDTVVLASDAGIFWKVNFRRFHQYIRDQIIINAVANKIDKKCAEVMRTVLRLSEVNTDPEAPVTNPVTSYEIFQALPKELGLTKPILDQYLSLLTTDVQTEFIIKEGDRGGGTYRINFEKLMTGLCRAHIESVVQERFGSKSLRIFRVLLTKRQLEQKQIEEYAMIPAKEAKELLYRMFAEQFVKHTEVPKTPDHAPSRTFYLFGVDLNQVSRMLLERCYQAVDNVIKRKIYECKENKRVLDKQQRVEAITASLEQSGADASQKEEIEEMITPPERALLAKVKHMKNKLEQSEIQVDETIFVLQTFIHYNQKA